MVWRALLRGWRPPCPPTVHNQSFSRNKSSQLLWRILNSNRIHYDVNLSILVLQQSAELRAIFTFHAENSAAGNNNEIDLVRHRIYQLIDSTYVKVFRSVRSNEKQKIRLRSLHCCGEVAKSSLGLKMFINSRTAIAGAIIGLLLVFTSRSWVLVFLRFFLPELLFVQTLFWPKSESEKNFQVN